ncbi:putative membrane protein [Microbacterium terrae]|uniref:DUF998 domain-containing protein n=1 Tax=Microbacterium terrae TaxID=69369 RepID=A0A0M2H7G5_9MICO|nr:DUF998 domain-containing protein [Microbacterium terrae]KJL40526.1 hypothetical protein RS81_01610 [Microbacterium terrae]MBP1079149.1 putative membrane protein [Microbacterium terrae]GLJ98550.1 hypothetical protein GCM10017594_17470 [Microbacterium terrae]
MSDSSSSTAVRSSGLARVLDTSDERARESLSLTVGAVAFVLVVLAALVTFGFADLPIAGPGSIGQFTAVASGIVAFVAFVAGLLLTWRSHGRSRIGLLDVVDIVALAFAHAVIAVLGWTLLAIILEQAFIGATVFALPSLMLAGAGAATTAYVVFYSATHMDLPLLAVVLAVFLTMGVLSSMLTATDPNWWHDNLSALGMSSNVSAWAFNITIVVAGFLVTTLARYTTRDIPTDNPKGTARVRLTLIIVGIFLACVGIFHVDDFFALHTGVASGMAVAFAVLVFRLPHWITGVTRTFVMVGWVFVAVIVVLAVLFAIQYYTLTAVELVAGVLVFTWIILFIRNAAALKQDSDAAMTQS